MKRSTKRSIAVSCALLATGCFLIAAGHGMGGRLGGGRSISIGGSNGIHISGSGIYIGGSNGIYVGPDGISIGGRNGIYVGPAGIRIGGLRGIESAEIDQVTFEMSPVTQLIQTNTIPNDPAMSEISEQFQGGFTQLMVDVDLADIKVEHGSGYGVTLTWNVDGYELRYDYDGDQLTVWSESRGHQAGQINQSARVVITLPVSCKLEYVSLETALGDIYWAAKSNMYNVQLSTNCGDVYWGGKNQADSVTLETDLGDIWVYGLTAKNLWAVSDLGDIRLEVPRSGDDISYDLATALGSVSAYGKKYGEDYSYTAPGESCYVYARTSLGDVNLDYMDTEA